MNNEKATLIEQLRALYNPLSKIDLLSMDRNDAMDACEKKKKKLKSINDAKGNYDLSKVKVPHLPTNNESSLKAEFDRKHRIKEAERLKKKAGGFITLILIVAVISIVAAAVMNILAYNNDPEAYMKKFALFTQSNRNEIDLEETKNLSKLPLHYAFVVIDGLMFALLSATFIKSLNKKVKEAMNDAGIGAKEESGLLALGAKLGGLYLKGFTIIMTICGIVLLALETPILLVCPVILFLLYLSVNKKVNPREIHYFSYTSAEYDELSAAKALDEKNQKENQKKQAEATKKEKAAQDAKWQKEYAAADDEYTAAGNLVKDYDRQIAEIRATLPTGIVSAKEMNAGSVASLIGYLESGRADNLKEALACLDKERAESARTESLLRQQQFQHDLDRQMDDWQRKEDRYRHENELRDLRDRLDSQHRQRQNELERHNREVERKLDDIAKS